MSCILNKYLIKLQVLKKGNLKKGEKGNEKNLSTESKKKSE